MSQWIPPLQLIYANKKTTKKRKGKNACPIWDVWTLKSVLMSEWTWKQQWLQIVIVKYWVFDICCIWITKTKHESGRDLQETNTNMTAPREVCSLKWKGNMSFTTCWSSHLSLWNKSFHNFCLNVLVILKCSLKKDDWVHCLSLLRVFSCEGFIIQLFSTDIFIRYLDEVIIE
jgi:hypothetical protein